MLAFFDNRMGWDEMIGSASDVMYVSHNLYTSIAAAPIVRLLTLPCKCSQLKSLKVKPDPPRPGETLEITAVADVLETIKVSLYESFRP